MGISFSRRTLRILASLVLVFGLVPGSLVAAQGKTISAVEIQEEEGVTRIILRGAAEVGYTAFMREDPPRLVVELTDAQFEGVGTPIQVQNGMVGDVTLAAFGGAHTGASTGQVSIALADQFDYEVVSGGDEIVVEVRATGGAERGPMVAAGPEAAVQAATPRETEAPPAAPAEMDSEPSMSAADEDPEEASTVPDEPAVDAVKIHAVKTGQAGIEVMADGPVDNVDSFVLNDPERVVVDFWGVKSAVWPDKIAFDEGAVTRARVGEHADKVRVVLDLRSVAVDHRIVPTNDGVRVEVDVPMAASAAITEDDEPTPAAPAEPEVVIEPEVASELEVAQEHETEVEPEIAPEPEAKSEPMARSTPVEPEPAVEAESPVRSASGKARIASAHFESLPSMDRVVVEMDRPVAAEIVEPDPSTLIVRLPRARIAEDVERRVDTSEFGGPIELFSVFQTPDVSADEVRIVLRRSSEVGAALAWEGSRLTVAIAHPRAGEHPSASASVSKTSAKAAGSEAEDSDTHAQTEEEGVSQPAASVESSQGAGASKSSDSGEPQPVAVPATPAAAEAYGVLSEDPFADGPADPAAIDILEEGGFEDDKGYQGRRISLDFKDAEIANILRLIAEVSDLNVIAGDEVEGEVTIRLVDVPWDQALDVILLTKGLGFVRVGNVLRIAPLETLKLEREARLQERRAKEKLEDLVVKLQPVNYANVKEVKGLIERLLSARGSVNVDERTSTLIIKDIPSVIHEATALVKAIDTQTPQVLIEAKIVEASLNFSRALGATWGVGYRPLGSRAGGEDFHLRDGTISDAGTPVGLSDSRTDLANNFVSSNPITGVVNGILSLGILGLDQHLQLDLQLAAAEENRKGKVISSPRVVTLDNREAVIKQGVAIKFTEATRDKITTSFIDAVLELKVTPHITANKSIIMEIKVTRNAPQLSAATGEVVGIDKNETETEALVRDGETMVLGGIYVVENGNNRSKLPFLADIPLIGSAFQSKTVQDERRELLVFVTPRVVVGPTPDL